MFYMSMLIGFDLRSREPLKRFSQNLVLYKFRAREDDLDKSQTCKKSGCLSVQGFDLRSREPF